MGLFRRSKPTPLSLSEQDELGVTIDRISSAMLAWKEQREAANAWQGYTFTEWGDCLKNRSGWSMELWSATRSALDHLPPVAPEEAIKRMLCLFAFVDENYAKTGKGQRLAEAPISEMGKAAQDIFHEFSALLQRLYATPSH